MGSLGDKCERRTFSSTWAGSFWRCVFMYPQYCTISYFDNVLNKINIISAAEGLWGINVSDEYFLIHGRVIFGECFYLSPILHNFHLRGKKIRKTNRQIDQIKLKEKKEKRKRENEKGKWKKVKEKREKEKENEKQKE